MINSKTLDGRFDEATSVSITYAVLGWIGTASTAIWGVVAATIQQLAGFFPAIPAMDSHLPTPTLSVFVLGAVLWFGMFFIGGVDKKIITLSFIVGLAYVLTFIVGVAPIAKFTTSKDDPLWNGMYVITQQVSWWGVAVWAIFTFGVLGKKDWAIPVGLFAGTMSMLAGYPLGLHNALFEVYRFSMFLPAPILSTGLLIYLMLLPTRKILDAWNTSAE